MAEDAREPGCDTCFIRDVCPDAAEGRFCAWWHTREPAREGEDPNELWRRGEEACF